MRKNDESDISSVNEEFGEVDGSGLVLEIVGEGDRFPDTGSDTAETAVDGEGFSGTDVTGRETGEYGIDETAVGNTDHGASCGDLEHIIDGAEHSGSGLRNGFDVAGLTFTAREHPVAFIEGKTGETAVIAFDEVIEDGGGSDPE